MKIRSAAFNIALRDELASRKRKIARMKLEREKEVYQKVPQIGELDASIRALAFDIGRKIMDKPIEGGLEAADRIIEEKLNKKRELLRENGFPEDYLEPKYICPECRDTGRVQGELCRCVTQLAIDMVFENCGINKDQSFDSFDLSLQADIKNRTAMSKILENAIAYCEAFPNNEKHDILYFGMPGVGKSYLLNCIGGRVLERGYSVLKINAYELIQRTLDNLRSAPEDRPDYILPDLLLIDDLGTEPMIPNITIETLLSILCRRQDLSKATLIATNLELASDDPSAATLQTTYGERFASRLMSPANVKIQAIRTENVRLTAR